MWPCFFGILLLCNGLWTFSQFSPFWLFATSHFLRPFFAIFRNFCNFRFSQFSLLWLFAMSHFFETFCARLVYAMSQLFETFCARVVYAMSQLFWDFFVQGWFTRKKYETALFPSSSTTGHCLNFLDHLLIFALRWCIFEILRSNFLIFYTRNF